MWNHRAMGVMYDYFSAASDAIAASALDMVGGPGAFPTQGFDPVADLGTIEELLTGADFESLLTRPRHGRVVGARDGGERLVVTISDELRAVLANTGAAELSATAGQSVNDRGSGDAALLAHLLSELSALARGAIERDERLYCWICVLSPRPRVGSSDTVFNPPIS
jgi:hypothetical protein